MVFRKPYAFLIKNFRLMHIIMTVCCIYLIAKTSAIANFLSDYLSSSDLVIGQEIVSNLYSVWMFVLPILIIIFLGVLLAVMIAKEKPKAFYIVNIIVYIAIFIIFIYGRGVLADMEKELVQPRTLKSLHDMFIYAMIFQAFTIIVASIRGIGFDIKKFDFARDLQALDVSSEDNEEFEVSIDYDFNDTKRKFKKRLRHLKYTYLENKLIVNSILVVVLVFVCIFIYKNTSISITKYKENKYFNMNSVSTNVLESYIVNTDYMGNKLNTNLVVLEVSVKTSNIKNKKLVTGSFELVAGDKKYQHTINYNKELKDIGSIYTNQQLGSEYATYLLVYDVGKSVPKDMKLQVSNIVNEDYVYVNLSSVNLTKEGKKENYKLGDEVTLASSTLAKTTFKINSFDIKERFTIKYNFCDNKNNCLESIEYLRPDYYNTNHDKTLLKLKADFTTEDNLSGLYDLISLYGKLEYKLNDEVKIQKVKFKQVKSTRVKEKNTYYIEVLKEVENASEITLILNVRNNEYRYRIK